MLPVVATNVSAVTCPRKGPFSGEISVVICRQNHDDAPGACAAYRCANASRYAANVELIESLKESRNATHGQKSNYVVPNHPEGAIGRDIANNLENIASANSWH